MDSSEVSFQGFDTSATFDVSDRQICIFILQNFYFPGKLLSVAVLKPRSEIVQHSSRRSARMEKVAHIYPANDM